MSTFSAPWTTLKDEIVIRYLGALGGLDSTTSGLKRLKLLIPIAYWLGLAGVLLSGVLRRQKGMRELLILTGIYSLVLAFTDGRKSQCYLIHIIPLYCALLAAWVVFLWRRSPMLRPIVATAIAVLYVIHAGGIAYQVRQDTYHKSYLPAIHFLQQNVAATQTLMAPGSFGIALHYPSNMVDDITLGFHSGKTPDWIVVNDWYTDSFAGLRAFDRSAYEFVHARVNNEFRPVYNQNGITIYRRR